MWGGLHTTSCNISAWASPPPPLPPPAATNISFDDHNHLLPVNPSPRCLCKDDVSISTSSFISALGHHSALTPETYNQPPLETTTSSGELMIGSGHSSGVNLHLWNHFLFDGTSEDLDKYQPEIRGSSPDPVPMEGASPGGASEPAACNYLNKMDNTYWDSPLDKDYFSSNGSSLVEGERQSKFSDSLTGDWSNGILSDCPANGGMVRGRDFNRYPHRGHDYPNVETEPPYRTAVGKCATAAGLHQIGSKVASCGSARSLADLISFGGRLIGSPPLDVKLLRPSPAPNNIRKRGLKNASTTRENAREHGSGATDEGKRKRPCQDSSSEKLQKKHKHESSTVATPTKVPVPKAKLGDRIATLQQIVSPFGKTDTASVLMEAIAYIKILQKQIELLISRPHMKTHPYREYSWGGLDPKGVKLDLKSRGLCLVPISCAPQAYRENAGSDYWAPPYRGIFYR